MAFKARFLMIVGSRFAGDGDGDGDEERDRGLPRDILPYLIVEDEAQVLILAESCLQEHGHQTRSASTIPEASAILDGADKTDVLFTDIGLRDDLQAGLELAKLAVERRFGYTSGWAQG
jgi:hypothetical protein